MQKDKMFFSSVPGEHPEGVQVPTGRPAAYELLVDGTSSLVQWAGEKRRYVVKDVVKQGRGNAPVHAMLAGDLSGEEDADPVT